MNLLLWLEQKENATLILALIGAVNGTLGLLIGFLSRRDALGQARQERARRAPWVSLRIEAGDHAGCLVHATVFNPGDVPLVVTEIAVETPHGWQAILMHPDPADLLGPPVPDVRRGAALVPVKWTVPAAAEMAEARPYRDTFIVAAQPWSPAARQRWRPAARMRETELALRFRGYLLSAAREPVDLLAEARI